MKQYENFVHTLATFHEVHPHVRSGEKRTETELDWINIMVS